MTEKQLINTYRLHYGRYVTKEGSHDISDLTGDQVFKLIQAIESDGLLWEYQKITDNNFIPLSETAERVEGGHK